MTAEHKLDHPAIVDERVKESEHPIRQANIALALATQVFATSSSPRYWPPISVSTQHFKNLPSTLT